MFPSSSCLQYIYVSNTHCEYISRFVLSNTKAHNFKTRHKRLLVVVYSRQERLESTCDLYSDLHQDHLHHHHNLLPNQIIIYGLYLNRNCTNITFFTIIPNNCCQTKILNEKFGTQIIIIVIYVIIDSNLMFRRYKIKNKLQMFC